MAHISPPRLKVRFSMPQDILPILREEEQRLVAELNQTPLFQKLEAVRRMIGVYSGSSTSKIGEDALAASPALRSSARSPAKSGKGAAILDAAEAYLESIGRRAQTGEIAVELIRRGVPPGRKNPNGATSAYLSGAKDRFDNKLGEGYGLVKWSSRPKESREAFHSSPEGEAEGMAPSVPSLTHQ
jgi:hypothetical protein